MWRWNEQERRVDALESRMATDELFYGLVASRSSALAAPKDPFASPPSRKSAGHYNYTSGAMDVDASASAFTTPPSRGALVTTSLASAGAYSFPRRLSGSAEVLAEASRPPDVVLHVGGCAFALHMRVLRRRGRGLYKKLLLLRDHAPADLIDTDLVSEQRLFTLKLLNSGEDDEEGDAGNAIAAAMASASTCPLAYLETFVSKDANGIMPTWQYTRCASHWDANRQLHQQQQPHYLEHAGYASPPIKTEAMDTDEDVAYFSPWRQPDKKQRSDSSDFFQQLAVAAAIGVRRRGVAHVELLSADPESVATCIEYMYTKKARFVRESNAEQVARLCEWLDLKGSIYYRCLRLAAAQVTPRNWMRLVCTCASLDDPAKRHVLIQQLIEFLPTLRPDQYMEFMHHSDMMTIGAIQDRSTLINVMVGIIHYTHMIDIWWNLFHAVDFWLRHRGPLRATSISPSPPTTQSLLTLHHHYASWEPVCIIPKCEFYHQQNVAPTVATLVEFGEFALQVRFELGGTVPILWRIIKISSPKYANGEPLELEPQARDLMADPKFCIRGQLKVKYQRPSHLESVVKEEVSLEYQHCVREYGSWRPLVSTMSSSAAVVGATEEWWTGQDATIYDRETGGYRPRKTIAKIRGKVFVWGDTLCNLYHYLLVSTLFYCPPISAPREIADLVIIQEMQRLPLDTLVLVLLSDRLRLPGGETTLVRILTKMIFRPVGGKTTAQPWRGYNGRARDVVAIFRCVRWCFVHLSQILSTLAKSPRRLRLYELIQDGLKNTHLRFRRRTPWGWLGDVDAYAINTTNLADFEIEAGDRHLSPSQFDDADIHSGSSSGGGDRDASPSPFFPPLLPGVS